MQVSRITLSLVVASRNSRLPTFEQPIEPPVSIPMQNARLKLSLNNGLHPQFKRKRSLKFIILLTPRLGKAFVSVTNAFCHARNELHYYLPLGYNPQFNIEYFQLIC